MAPLYNRYIPPKSTATPGSAAVQPPKTISTLPAPDSDNKRKRERSETEQAERKAKKLRKKGVEDAAGAVAAEVGSADAVALPLASPDVEDAISTPAEVNAAPLSEFAHVKSAKKRHKLEKEARKARKQAEKLGEDAPSVSDARNGNEETDDGQTEAELTEVVSLPNEKHEGEHLAIVPTSDIDEAAARKEEKRRKKRQKQGERENQAVDGNEEELAAQSATERSSNDPVADEDISMRDVAGSSEPVKNVEVEKPKKRRHKLEAALRPDEGDTQEQDASEDSDEHLKNHSSVLSKFQKAKQLAEKRAQQPGEIELATPEPQVEKRDLAPFPQPVNEPQNHKPTFSALPPWLAEPMTVSNDAKRSFAKLQLPMSTLKQVTKLGFEDALPVQQALVPLLLPPGTNGSSFPAGTEGILPDVAVSAATGSGKTIAYLLPMIEALKSKSRSLGRLRALVVVPTRELVTQVASVAESLAKGSTLKVGTASGVGKFKDEQHRLVKTGSKYDPTAYATLMEKANRRDHPPPEESEDFEDFIEGMEQWNDHQEQELQDALNGLIDHVPTYSSGVDLLVCTPGRLLEHLGSTLGFGLTHVEWLVLDEADKLLDQQYDGFLQRLNEELSRPRADSEQDAREKALRKSELWDEQQERHVRKVVLSATMTRDISKLVALKLRRPKMVVVQGAELDATIGAQAEDIVETEGGIFELPPTLKEFYVPVGDGSEKPLYLLELLRTSVGVDGTKSAVNGVMNTEQDDDDNSEDSSSSSDSDSDSDSESDSGSSGSSTAESSTTDGSSSSDSSSVSDTSDTEIEAANAHKSKEKAFVESSATAPTVLVFTSSTESATRLSHLLAILEPSYKRHITTLTKTTSRQNPFSQDPAPSDPVIAIATDRAGRGLDTLANRRITHVLQYDVPRSVTGYVHRVGRTARAGRGGEAWTLYTEKEARWFVNEIVRTESLRRVGAVERVRVESGGEVMKERFAEALGGMRDVVFGKVARASRAGKP